MKQKNDKKTKIDWDALDEQWANDYEEDYGHLKNDIVIISEYP